MTEFETQNTDVGGVVETTASSSQETQQAQPQDTHDSQSENEVGAKYVLEKQANGKSVVRIIQDTKPHTTANEAVTANSETAQQTVQPMVQMVSHDETPPAVQVPTQQMFGVAGNEPRAQPYSIADINTAIQAGIPLAQERIPSELVGWYQQKQMEMQQKNAPDVKEQQRAFFKNVAQKAKADALAELEMSEEDLTRDIELLDFEEQEKLQQKRQAFHELAQLNQSMLLNQAQFEMVRQAQEREAQLNVVRGIVAYAEELSKSEPNFQQINDMMRTHYQTLPYQDGAVVKEAIDALSANTISQRQAEVLRDYYEKTRLAFYAAKNNLTVKPQTIATPPVTEKAAGGAYQQAEVPDWESMRGMTQRERNQYIVKYLRKQE